MSRHCGETDPLTVSDCASNRELDEGTRHVSWLADLVVLLVLCSYVTYVITVLDGENYSLSWRKYDFRTNYSYGQKSLS